MATLIKHWSDGEEVTISYNGSGDGYIKIECNANTIPNPRYLNITI